MRDYISLVFVLCLLVGGSALVYDGITTIGKTQGAAIVIGALLLAFGSFAARPVVRDWKEWWEWRKRLRKFESQ